MKNFSKISLIILLLLMSSFGLMACNDGTTNTYSLVLAEDKIFEFYLGDVDLSGISVKYLEKSGDRIKVIESFPVTKDMISDSDNKKLTTIGVHSITLTKYNLTLVFSINIIEQPSQTHFLLFFNSNGGTPVEAQYTNCLTEIPYTYKEGYNFAGWYSDILLVTNQAIVPYTILAETTLYAKWVDTRVFKVEFLGFNSSIISTQLVEFQKAAIAPILPPVIGYTFDGWDTSFNKIVSDCVIKPIFKKITFTITFKSEMTLEDRIFIVNYGEDFNQELIPIVPAKNGHTGEWVDLITNARPIYREIKANFVITARYTPNPFTITFKSEMVADNITKTVYYGQDLLPSDRPNVPNKTGHIGVWKVKQGDNYVDPNYTNIQSNIMIEAVYTKLSYTITFKENARTIIVFNRLYQETFSNSEVPTLKDINSNYSNTTHQLDWYLSNEFKPDQKIDFGGNILVVKNLEYYAKVVHLPYTVEFRLPEKDLEGEAIYKDYSDYNAIITTRIVQAGGNATVPALPYEISLRYSLESKIPWNKATVNITKNMIGEDAIFANLIPKKFEVKFFNRDADGVYSLMDNGTYGELRYGTKLLGDNLQFGDINNYNPGEVGSNSEYVFDGWYENINFTSERIVFSENSGYVIEKSTILYAKWVDNKQGTLGLIYTLDSENNSYSVSNFLPTEDITVNSQINVTIPNEYNGIPVRSISANVFSEQGVGNAISSIFIPKNINTIEDNAFLECAKLKYFVLETDGNFVLDNNILYSKDYSQLVSYPAGAESPMETIELTQNTRVINGGAFANVKHLVKIDAKNISIEFIGIDAFRGAEELKTIELSSALKSIGSGAFAGCYKLDTIVLTNSSLIYVGENALVDTQWYKNQVNNPSTKTVVLDKVLIKYIGTDATYTVGDNIIAIANMAFEGAKELKELYFSSSSQIKTLGSRLFYGCSNLDKVIVASAAPITFYSDTFDHIKIGAIVSLPDASTIID